MSAPNVRPRRLFTKPRVLATTVVLTALALTACSSGGSNPAASVGSKKQLKFGLIIMDTTNPFQATMAAAAEAEAKKRGIMTETLNGNLNISNQVAHIQQQIAKGVDALIVNAVDPDGILPAIKLANAAKIPVFALNTNPGKGADIVTFVGADDYQYGLAQGDLVAKALNGKGNVALIMGQVGTSPQILRTKGIEETLAKYPNIKIVAKVADDWKNAKSLAAVQDLLTKYPVGQLDVIVAQGPQIYVGAQWAAKQGRTDVKFIAGDYPTQVSQSIKDGQIYGTVLQSPETEGQMAIDLAQKYVQGDKSVAKPNTYIKLPLITQENVSEYQTVWNW